MGSQNPEDIQVLVIRGRSAHGLCVQPSRLSAHALTAKLHCKQSPLPLLHCFSYKFGPPTLSLIASWL